ncbi:MAG: 1-deoxy-D-xylulose-5-phosphate reductoisomerase [Clostridia bacterium]|nr:1-deoxy-D-xylulose-5-phosphate reductoisomerase [Clostridia bacterium]
MKPSLILLGSTGSIGTQALDVARKHGFPVRALTAAKNSRIMEDQIREFRPAVAALSDEAAAADLRARVADLPVKVLSGEEGILEAAALESDIALNAIVGIAGLRPTMTAIETGHTIALANKETLVTGGALVTKAAKEKGVKILPVDSEHSAVFQCLQAQPTNRALRKIILTASGGPFFGKTAADLAQITPAQALKHPNWSMGAKITIDSATMMNKGLEVMEASWLFDLPEDKIDVVVHRESIIHSMVEFDDYAVLAQLGVPDMKIPIQYAITYPERYECPTRPLKLSEYGTLTFFEPDNETFKGLPICREALRRGGLSATAVNGANEEAVAMFLAGKISFPQITQLVQEAMDRQPAAPADSIEHILEADRAARAFVRAAVAKGATSGT